MSVVLRRKSIKRKTLHEMARMSLTESSMVVQLAIATKSQSCNNFCILSIFDFFMKCSTNKNMFECWKKP